MTPRKDPEMVWTETGFRQKPGETTQAAPSLHEEVCSDARKLAHEIHSDVFAGEAEIAAAIEAGFRFRENRLREECAEIGRERDEALAGLEKLQAHNRSLMLENANLENQRAEMLAALKPFAALLGTDSNGYEQSPDDDVVRSVGTIGRDYTFITVRDLRRSRDVLARAEGRQS